MEWLTDRERAWCVAAAEEWRRRLPAIRRRLAAWKAAYAAEHAWREGWRLCDW